MTLQLEDFDLNYNTILGYGDPRVAHWPFMQTPIPILILFVTYVLFVFKIGPDFMRKRKPYDIARTIKYYNLMQIFFNFLGIIAASIRLPYVSLWCTSSEAAFLPIFHYLYFLLKCFDLLDTVFFVLRKKFNQITFLHLYHHILMLVGSWITCKYVPGGQLFFLGFANVFVHLCVYFYYFLTVWDPVYKKNIWWKRHLTELQIIQHCFVFCVFLVPLFNESCSYPKSILAAYLPAVLLMIYLFTDFYINAYITPARAKVVKE